MKRIAVLILALALMLTGSALAVYDPAASTPTMWGRRGHHDHVHLPPAQHRA